MAYNLWICLILSILGVPCPFGCATWRFVLLFVLELYLGYVWARLELT